MNLFNTDEGTISVRMTGWAGYGSTEANGVPAVVLDNGQTYHVPVAEAGWLITAGLAELL
jgi:hypothetical protein